MGRLATAPLALGAAVAVTACGSSQKKLSRAEYIRKADAACAATNRNAPRVPAPRTTAQAKAAANREAQIRQKLADQLDELSPPDQLKDNVDAYAKQTNELVTNLERQGDDAGNLKAFTADQFAFNQLAVQRAKTATKIGYAVCAQPGPGQKQPLGDEELVTNADPLCKLGNDAALAATPAQQPQLPRDLPRIAAGYDSSLPVHQRVLVRLKGIKPPPESQEDWSIFLNAFEQRIKLTQKQRAAAEAKDQKAFQAASQQDGQINQQEAQAANALGLEVCGQNGTSGV